MKKRNLWKMLMLAMTVLLAPILVTAGTVIPPTPVTPNPLYPAGIGWNPVVDYTKSNFSQSPNLRKFVDSLPGLGYANRNNLGQYIPIAIPDTTTYAGDATSSAANPASDYYEIALGQYFQQLHSDLPASGTQLRGYYQVNTTDPTVLNVKQYLGPAIIAKTYDPTKPAGVNGNGKPVRVKFYNRLPTGAAGVLPLPVDTTIMGAGTGPNGGTENYTETRATIHLHGGATPWISDGTPHQWITPQGELTSYAKGASFQNVPDMVTGTTTTCRGGATCFSPVGSDGIGTFYWTNQQSARLMFYHDHAYGITRLNVYDGMAAPFLLVDQYEEDMISGTNVAGANPTNAKLLPDLGGVYHYGIPLVIQDKSFVNDATTPSAAAIAAFPTASYTQTPKTLATDPLWHNYAGTTGGNLWYPHEYLPVENPNDPTGNTPTGRWDYAPFMIPAMLPLNLTLPSPTLIPEGFQDTMIVNGTAFPYVALPPDALRFRILNACGDRTINLSLFYAKDRVTGQVCKQGNTFTPANCTEVSMVPAAPNTAYPTWPRDGRDGGVPDPTTQGPSWIQIQNEGGVLPQVAVLPPQPVDFNYNRQVIVLAGVTSHSLLLMPAVRADVVVDFSAYKNGDVLMLYNDAPAPMPNFWPLNDYYTDGPDQTAVGGPVTIPPGFGPNTRTVMQIRITGSKTSTFDFSTPSGASLVALQAALPKVFAASQPAPHVPQLAYNAAYPSGPHHYNGTVDNYVQGYQTTLNISGAAGGLSKIKTMAPGNNYVTPPTVVITGGGGTGAAATAQLNPIGAITLLTGGTGYTSAPTIALSPPNVAGSVQATAVATISGGSVNAITIDEPGSGYNSTVTPPTCSVTGGGGTGATCSVMLSTLNTVGSIVLTNVGSGYTKQPEVFLVPAAGSNGSGAAAVAMLTGDLAMTGKNITEGFDVDFGRMDIRLGSTPNPLTPGVGNGFVIGLARYIDPPTEIMTDGDIIVWRITHLGVDSHAAHFHLFNMQLINRVDWTNVIKPPSPEELGWKETLVTKPMEDMIVAIKPMSMVLPFTIPNSIRVLDPTTPVNSTTNFYPVAPPAGVPAVAQQSNVMTDFGWEYVWHCHLLGHEENDMMRPLVLTVASAVPLAPGRPTATVGTGKVTLVWTNNAATTSLNAPNGFIVMAATGATSTVFTPKATIYDKTVLTYVDTAVASGTTYRYEIVAFNDMGNSPASGIRNATVGTFTNPTVTLTSPVTGATYTAPATIPLTATVTSGGTATISKVEYYNGISLLGTAASNTAPYAFSFANVNAGTLSLTAKVYNSLGLTAVSSAVTVTVNSVAVAPPIVATKIGVSRSDGTWYLDKNGNGTFDAGIDSIFSFGIPGDVAVTGDWNGSGTTKIGVFRSGTWYLDMNGNGTWDPGIDVVYSFGIAGDVPVTGDWNGTGTTKIGVYRNGEWYLDTNGNGVFDPGVDAIYSFGITGDIPVTGNWSGTGGTKIGVYRGGEWYLDMNGNGTWDPGIDVVRSFGIAGDVPATGDWNATGTTKIGIFRSGVWYLDTNGNGVFDPGIDAVYSFGIATDKPITGKW